MDVTECTDYLASVASEEVSEAWYAALKTAVAGLQNTPELSRVRHDLPVEGVRTIHLRKYPDYLVSYRLTPDAVELSRVWHGAMHKLRGRSAMRSKPRTLRENFMSPFPLVSISAVVICAHESAARLMCWGHDRNVARSV
jgi:plasmid stabilization system protein ParE